jgi:serine/threonine-protein kinase
VPAATTGAYGQSSASTPAPAAAPKRRTALIVAVAGVVVVGGVVAVFALRGGGKQDDPGAAAPPPAAAAVTAPAPTPAPTPAPAPVEPKIKITLSAKPAEAKLFLDEAALPSNPYATELKPDGSGHKLRAEAPGHAPQTHFVVFDQDRALDIVLVADAPPAGATKRPTGTRKDPKKIDTDNPYDE